MVEIKELGSVFAEVKRPGGVKLTIHLHQMPRLTMVELYLHFSVRLQGVVLN
jgi:hypothetical protein